MGRVQWLRRSKVRCFRSNWLESQAIAKTAIAVSKSILPTLEIANAMPALGIAIAISIPLTQSCVSLRFLNNQRAAMRNYLSEQLCFENGLDWNGTKKRYSPAASSSLRRGRASLNTFPVWRLRTRRHKPLGFS